ncbi:SOSS complex subunit C-like isoform X1 [Gambusia affinis]|uniref:SOSS complex subunit C-like isoform X1 n=1 Tax=Gambusia affinis TaxID=33528 RepID=UPI001CDBA8EE|nr:SOSS complex subunit C-like isoform X1 [Gambusia affinis]
MATNPPGQAIPSKARVAILAELEKEKRRLRENQSMNVPGARRFGAKIEESCHVNIVNVFAAVILSSHSIPLSRPNMKEFRDSAELQHIAAQQRAALQHAHAHSSGFFITQDSSFGNLILPVLPRLEPQS